MNKQWTTKVNENKITIKITQITITANHNNMSTCQINMIKSHDCQ